ncbi:MAG: isochorismatase family protein [Prevotellaceae bacterium]|jgi:nicotinamidase-related amidase|nr:isochorismatase family protein [Prevotellaceae bacterium]
MFQKFKYRAIASLFAAVILFASCDKSNDSDDVQEALLITAFSFEGQDGKAQIDSNRHSIKINAKCGTDLAAITASFTLSPEGIRAKVEGVPQTSGESVLDFSAKPVVYTLTSADGKTTVDWEITVVLPDNCPALMTVNLQKRDRNGTAEQFVEKWNPLETAIIVIDMWSTQTWETCAHNAVREEQLSVAMNGVFDVARDKGILVVFAPSTEAAQFDKWYGNLPARKTSEKYRHGYGNPAHWDYWWHGKGGEREVSGLAFPGEKDAFGWPSICQDCPEKIKMDEEQPPQIKTLKIDDRDIITDDFIEMIGGKDKFNGKLYDECLFKERGIKNVIITGCHTDICIIGRPFACRALKVAGYNAVICRDLTNSSSDYNCANHNKNKPTHIEYTANLCNYIETWICPSITSTEITGKPAFEFDEEEVFQKYPVN